MDEIFDSFPAAVEVSIAQDLHSILDSIEEMAIFGMTEIYFSPHRTDASHISRLTSFLKEKGYEVRKRSQDLLIQWP